MKRVVITGMGWITPMGHTIEEAWKRLLAGESGVARTSIFNAGTFPTSISAEIKNFDLSKHIADYQTHRGAGRNTQFALAACEQAWKSVGLDKNKLDLDRVGLYLASGEGSLDFDGYTTAALSSWQQEIGGLDTGKWAQMARELTNVTREIEQEPNM